MLSIAANAQVDTSYAPATPVGGINRLALVYYDIEFTPEQRKLLDDVNLELIFSVTDEGAATLETVNGITNSALIDSLYAQSDELPGFIPEMRSGIPIQSLYFMRFQFPTYKVSHNEVRMPNPFYRRKVEKDEFTVLNESGRGLDFVLHGIFVNHFGNADKYLKPGGGAHMGIEYLAANKLYYGLSWEMFGNNASAFMDVSDTLPYLSSPFSVTFGFYMGKRFDDFSVQLEASYASISITQTEVNDEVEEGTSFGGFSPGIFINYPIPLNARKERVTMQAANTYINRFSLNLRGGFRGFFMEDTQANAILFEIGLGIRFGSYFIEKYRLKDSYYLN